MRSHSGLSMECVQQLWRVVIMETKYPGMLVLRQQVHDLQGYEPTLDYIKHPRVEPTVRQAPTLQITHSFNDNIGNIPDLFLQETFLCCPFHTQHIVHCQRISRRYQFQYSPVTAMLLLYHDLNTVDVGMRLVLEHAEYVQQARSVTVGVVGYFQWACGLGRLGIVDWGCIAHYITVNNLTIYDHMDQKWITPFMSQETTYFLVGDGRMFMQLKCQSGLGPQLTSETAFFSRPESLSETRPLVDFWT